MRAATLRVAAAQLPACGSDLERNAARAEAAVRAAARERAALVVLPELTTLPYFCADRPEPYRGWAEPAGGPLTERFGALAAELGVSILLGLFELDRAHGTRHNAAILIGSDGAIVPAVDRLGVPRDTDRKLHLPVGEEPAPGFDEPAHFTAGSALGVHAAAGLRLGCLICYDRRFPECWRELRAQDARVVAVPVAGNGGDPPGFFLSELRTHARENGLAVVAASKVGEEWVAGSATESLGSSCIVGADGEVLAHRPREAGDGLVIADLDLEAVAEVRARLRYFEHRRTDLFGGPPPLGTGHAPEAAIA